jgi:hypothetical protein
MALIKEKAETDIKELANKSDDLSALNAIIDLLMTSSPELLTQNSHILDQITSRVLPRLDSIKQDKISEKLKLLNDLYEKKERNEKALLEYALQAKSHELLELAHTKNLPESVSSILVSRGHCQIVHALTANHSARLSKSSLNLILELAPSDLQLKENLIRRIDISETLLMRLLPFLNEQQAIQMLVADFTINSKIAAQKLNYERESCAGNGVDPSRAVDDSLKRLCGESRLYEIADMLAERLYLPLATTMNILNGRMDYCVALLLNASEASLVSVADIIKLREKMGLRQYSDSNSIYTAFNCYKISSAYKTIQECSKFLQKSGLVSADLTYSPDLFFNVDS